MTSQPELARANGLPQGHSAPTIVARIAVGLVHDFNNSLLGISGFTELALETLGHEHPARRYLEAVNELAAGASDVAQQLLELGRGEAQAVAQLDLNELVASTCDRLRRVVPDNICVVSDTCSQPLSILGRELLLSQLITNLVLNAVAATPCGGRILVRTSRATAMPDVAILTVADHGVGIAPSMHDQIFELGFTTKAPGRVAGIGLAAVRAVAEAHDGTVSVESRPGSGSIFTVRLPLS